MEEQKQLHAGKYTVKQTSEGGTTNCFKSISFCRCEVSYRGITKGAALYFSES